MIVNEELKEVSGDVAGGFRLRERQIDDSEVVEVLRLRPPREDGLGCLVMMEQIVDGAGVALRLAQQRDAGEGPGALADVVLGVEDVATEGEEFPEFAGVVLVGVFLGAIGPVEPEQHERIDGQCFEEISVVAQGVGPQHLPVENGQPIVPPVDNPPRGGEAIVPEEGHSFVKRIGAFEEMDEPATGNVVLVRFRETVDRGRHGALGHQVVDRGGKPATHRVGDLFRRGSEGRAAKKVIGLI
jgi:hypothetical protein